MKEMLHIIRYLAKKPKFKIIMDIDEPNIPDALYTFNASEFKEYDRDVKEELPFRMLRSRGKSVVTMAWVDALHGANKKTRRSHSGHIIFVNRAPVKWFSKRQQTVETSAFSSEFIALKQCIEEIGHIRFKLRSFGILIDEERSATCVLCDNKSTVTNMSNVELKLNKKHSSIAYRFARWHVAAGVCRIIWVASGDNLADALTKRLGEETRRYLFDEWTY